ncbi:rod shape-determining protein MreC [Streptococcus ovuberis]|uniref:Cell shape-determining protein MreC n=1 Tax=Streptococcus ovuberis TaxID=1936207 RepID=A0A7X6S2N8_9STRE|nr:rod shape-determining protein MreC [Streptococcus ovuberis]NKZ21451.1 rod shape-determining protein MreC [Streptococcus ovuberis]
MGKFFKSKVVVLVAVLLTTSLSFLLVSSQDWFRESSLFSPLRSVLSSGESFLSVPRRFISDIIEDTQALLVTFEENKTLKREISLLSGILDENHSLKMENESLRSSIKLENAYPNADPIVAEVVHRSPSSWNQSLLISKGETSGLSKGDLVLANGGLVGLVTELFTETATVQLLQDNMFKANLAVKIGDKNPAYGILNSFDPVEGLFLISQVTEKERLALKDKVVTSDLSLDYPGSLLLGEVTEIRQNKDSLEVEVYVKPSANFSDIYSVVVVGR